MILLRTSEQLHWRASLHTSSLTTQFQRLFTPLHYERVPSHDHRRQYSKAKIISTPSLCVSEDVDQALHANLPVVALETTIYTHGFPYPDNITLALDLEKIVRDNGAVPATIGVLDGVARVGLTETEIISLASSAGKPETMKVSRRDLPFILGMGLTGKKLNGGTTISATMILAKRAGIKVFGTGGLGGVHRGGEITMDISADLTELGRTSVAVISSGCKSFLDIPRTLEYLETQGCTVCTFADGRSGDINFPAFFTRESGVRSPMVIQSPEEAAAIIHAHEMLVLRSDSSQSGFLFANPIPEEHSIPKEEIDEAINRAVEEAAKLGFYGHANTPFILARIKELTKGNSIPANRALIKSNVAMAAKVAVELSRLRSIVESTPNIEPVSMPARVKSPKKSHPLPHHDPSPVFYLNPGNAAFKTTIEEWGDSPFEQTASVLVFGSVAVDLSCNYSPEKHVGTTPTMLTSNIATITPSLGGVGHNVALAAQRAGKNLAVSLRSVVAKDLAGASILAGVKSEGLDASGIFNIPKYFEESGSRTENRTAQYVAVNDANQDLVVAMADMSIFNDFEVHKWEQLQGECFKTSNSWVVVDANWRPSLQRWLVLGSHRKYRNSSSYRKVAFEPVSAPKAGRIFQPEKGGVAGHQLKSFPEHNIDLATPNQYELAAMHASAKEHDFFGTQEWWEVIDALGIPSSGARDRFVSITNRKMTDEGIPLQTVQLLPYIPTILTKLGAEGVLLTELLKSGDPRLTDRAEAPFILSRNTNGHPSVGGVYMRLFPPVEVVNDVVSVNGVGDTFLGVLIAGLSHGCKLDEKLINLAQRGAVMTLRSRESVTPDLGKLSDELKALAEEHRGVALKSEEVDVT